MLAAHVLRLRQVNFYQDVKDFRGFFVADEEIDALLKAGIFSSREPGDDERLELEQKLVSQAARQRVIIQAKAENSFRKNVFVPLAQLRQNFHLDDFEIQILVVCLAAQIEDRYQKLYAYLQNDASKKNPSVEFILQLLGRDEQDRLRHFSYFHPSAPLRHFGFLANPSHGDVNGQFLCLNARIVHYLLGDQTPDRRELPFLDFLQPRAWDEVVLPENLQKRLRQLLRKTLEEEALQRPAFFLHGRIGVGRKTVASALCSELGVALASIDLRWPARNPADFQEQIRLVLREGRLQPCAVYFDHFEALETEVSRENLLIETLAREINGCGWLTFLGSEKPPHPTLLETTPVCAVEIPKPDFDEQRKLWQAHLNGELAAENGRDLELFTARFDLTGKQIGGAARQARQAALARDPSQPQMTITDLVAGSRKQSQPKLSALARKIEPKFRWNDIILPLDQMQQLREIASHVKHRRTVIDDWGFSAKLSLGQGVNALFTGQSGTGKTMAAEVIANDLELDLYKIDLSAVVSKYIGETEKNLNRVFTEAEHSNAILFFDEADALLGKRSEVQDAHDRYANIEIAYLLQKMEEYRGVTILATNLRQNIDDAFTRRIRFIIEFPLPGEEDRLRIWRGVWPQATPRAPELDLDFLARRFKITGGNIRNIALSAAFYAAESDGAVEMKHLILAAKREFLKMGKLVSAADLGEYHELVR